MQLSNQDIESLRALQESNIGKWLVGYLERLVGEWVDVRTMKPDESVASRQALVALLEENLIERIKLGGQKKTKEPITTFE